MIFLSSTDSLTETGKSSKVISSPLHITTAHSTQFLNSRMFPGQLYFRIAALDFASKPVTFFSFSKLNSLKKDFTSRGMSSFLSRKDGIWILTTFNR